MVEVGLVVALVFGRYRCDPPAEQPRNANFAGTLVAQRRKQPPITLAAGKPVAQHFCYRVRAVDSR